MNNIYDQFYFDKEVTPIKEIDEMKEELIRTPANEYADLGPLCFYKETPEHLRVPRAFGIERSKVLKMPMSNKTIGNAIHWPELVLPGGWRPGQEVAISKTTKFLRDNLGGLLNAPTGAGKSLCGLEIARQLGQKTLVLVHKEDLAEVWRDSANKFYPGIKVGHVQQKHWEYKKCQITTALYQTVHRRGDLLDEGFRSEFGLIISDEGHRVAAPTFAGVLNKFRGRYRLGLSATWKRKDEMECLFYWLIGNVAHTMKTHTLKCFYYQVDFPVPFSERAFKGWGGKLNTAAVITAIAEFGPYNEYLAKQVDRAVAAGRKVLIVTDRLSQVEKLKGLIQSRTASYIGETDEIGRKAARTAPVIIGTYQAVGEGTDIPELDTLIMATPRSEITQVVGRIRRPHHSKKIPLILDPIVGMGYTKALAQKRLIAYHSLGFEEMKR